MARWVQGVEFMVRFAIPVDIVRSSAEQIIQYGKVRSRGPFKITAVQPLA